MKRNFTEDDILRYVYGESDHQESLLIKAFINANIEAKRIYESMIEMTGALDMLHYEPGETIIHILNEEARSSSLEIY